MGSCWISVLNPDDSTSYDFTNDDYGLDGPPDEILVGSQPVKLDDYSHISLHSNNDDQATWLVVTQEGQDGPRNEVKRMARDQAQLLLRELRLRARTKPKQGIWE